MSTTSDSLEDRASWWANWLDARVEEQLELDVELDDGDLIAFAAAALQAATDKAVAEIDRKVGKKSASLIGHLAVLRHRIDDLAADRQRHGEEAAAAQQRIASLEAEAEKLCASLAEAVKEVAEMRYEIARDRSWHRMIEERKFAPVTEVVAIEQARRRTQLAIQGRT
jgi:chromosome segregation ATPase